MAAINEIQLDPQDEYLLRGAQVFIDKRGYIRLKRNGSLHLLHRLIMNAKKGEIVDHRNRNKQDCRRQNLRITDHFGSAGNTSHRKHNTSGYRGVSLCMQTGLYRAEIRYRKKRICLGRYMSKIAAAIAYDKMAKILFGEYATLNFSTGKGCAA